MSSKSLTTEFTRLLFEANVIDSLNLLEDCLKKDHGYYDVMQCITAWQDLIDRNESPISPLLECLRDEDAVVVRTAISLICQLFLSTPDPATQFRLGKELKDLKFENQLSQVKLRNSKDPVILREIEKWYSIQKQTKTDTHSTSMEDAKTHLSLMSDPAVSDLLTVISKKYNEDERKLILNALLNSTQNQMEEMRIKEAKEEMISPKIPVPPPPPLSLARGPPPPPPPPNITRGPPPPPPLTIVKKTEVPIPESMKPKRTVDRSIRMKTLMWSKIAPQCVLEDPKTTVWGQLASENKGLSLDFDLIEGMFAVPTVVNNTLPNTVSKKKDVVVDLLTPKRSQNVTITLKRFKDLDQVLSDLRENKLENFDVETLKSLRAVLPDSDEIEALRRYSGDVSVLSPACSFFLQIISVPDYLLRIDCMIFQLEFHRCMEEACPNLALLCRACEELCCSVSLRRLLLLLVNIGNYLNESTAHGNAAGFKLNSLWKIIDLKASRGGATLLHAVARMEPHLSTNLQSELQSVSKASEISIEEIKSYLRQLQEQLKLLEKSLELKEDPQFQPIKHYLQNQCKLELGVNETSLNTLMKKQHELAIYFCDNPNTFKLEECLKIFKNFMLRLKQAQQENKDRDEREARKHGSSENGRTLRNEPKETGDNIQLFVALEKGSSNKIIRRRNSLTTVRSIELCRDRTSNEKPKRRTLKESKAIEKVTEQPNEQPDSKKEVAKHTETEASSPTKPTRQPRCSDHYKNTSNLCDYIQSLEKATTPIRAEATTFKTKEESICVKIPTDIEECPSSTAGSSPKSGSDEGFESEKDHGTPQANRLSSQTGISQTSRPANKTETQIKAPRLVSISVASASKIRTDKTNKSHTHRAPLAKQTLTIPCRESTISPSIVKSRINQNHSSRNAVASVKKEALDSKPRNVPQNAERVSKTPGNTIESRKIVRAVGNPVSSPHIKQKTGERRSTVAPPERRSTVSKPDLTSTVTKAERRSTVTSLSTGKSTAGLPSTKTSLTRKSTGSVLAAKNPCETVNIRNAVSTSSRPALIKTGSLSQRPKLRGMDTLEKPRPLKKTQSVSEPVKPTSRPKWV